MTTEPGSGGADAGLPPHIEPSETVSADVSHSPEAALEQWHREPPDPMWTEEVDGYVSDAFEELEVAGEVVATECKTTVCRLQLHFENEAEAYAFERQAGRPELNRRIVFEETEQGFDVDLMIGREAQSEPDPGAAPEDGPAEGSHPEGV